MRSERINGAHFRMTFYPPVPVTKTGDRHADVAKIMTDVNAMMESWIRERPRPVALGASALAKLAFANFPAFINALRTSLLQTCGSEI